MRRMRAPWEWGAVVLQAVVCAAAAVASGCAKTSTPVVRPQPPVVAEQTPDVATAPERPPAPSPPLADPPLPPGVPVDAIEIRNLDELNRDSPLSPVYFGLDRFDLDTAARLVLDASARVMRQQPTWQVTVEGHCDERGTAEYNISLGERRATAAKAYLVSLGIAAERLRTVSYGREFPFDPGHDETAWAKNRRAHFVITAK